MLMLCVLNVLLQASFMKTKLLPIHLDKILDMQYRVIGR